MSEEITLQPEIQTDIQNPKPEVRVGVFVCDCGNKIVRVVDTQALCQRVADLPEVVYTTRAAYPCSKDGLERMSQTIRDQDLTRVLVAGCSPRLMRDRFRQIGTSLGLARSFVNMANIREQCVYVHPDNPSAAFEKAAALIEMGVARLATVSAETPRVGRVVEAALVIGSDLPGLTVATNLADSGFRVVLVEHGGGIGENIPNDLLIRTQHQLVEKGKAVLQHAMIDTLFKARLVEVSGHPGDYEVRIQQGDQTTTYGVGAIIVANAAQLKSLGDGQWFDRQRVKTQAEFEGELDDATEPGKMSLRAERSNLLPGWSGDCFVGLAASSQRHSFWLTLNDIVMILCAEKSQLERCSRICCNIGVRQAIRAKQLNPNANVTVLFRELYLGGIGEAYEAGFMQARELGVTFFRYRRDRPPVIGSQMVGIIDTLTGEPIRIPFDRVVLTMPLIPQANAHTLAALLGLPLDDEGFLAEPRVRLRPGGYAEPGIHVLGSSQQPVDTDEALFQAYLTSSRVMRFLRQDSITVETPVAKIDATLCSGCGNCPQVCPVSAIKLEKRDGVLSLSQVDELRCFGCGNCVVVCPTKAITLPGWDDAVIPAQISAALQSRSFPPGAPKIIALACEWSAYAAADVAGAHHLSYPANVRIIRTNCSARFDPYHILWAFINGADGVFLGACPPGECHYGTGNLYAQERVEKLKTELAAHGVDPSRLHLEFLTVDEGAKFVQAMKDFVEEVQTDIPGR